MKKRMSKVFFNAGQTGCKPVWFLSVVFIKKKKKSRFDFGRRTTNVICIWRIIELRGRNMYKILTQCRPNTFNLKSKKMNKLCAPVLLSQVSCLSYLP